MSDAGVQAQVPLVDTNTCRRSMAVQTILVFQQSGSALSKIEGIRRFGGNGIDLTIISIDEALPAILDDASEHFPNDLAAALVLDYLKHPDLSDELARLCSIRRIPLVASGKKTQYPGVFSPPT
jgi:thymidylate synthase